MASISQLVCTTSGKSRNTGYDPNCFVDILQMTGGAKAPIDLVIPEEDLTPDGIIAYLKTLTLADDPDSRLYPMPDLELTAKSGGDLRKSTSQYGKSTVNGENPYDWTFSHRAGADLQSNLREGNANGGVGFIFWDKKTIYMLNNGDGTASPIPLDLFWALPIDPTNGTDPTLYQINIGMETDYLNDQRYAIQYTGSISSLKGLQDITLKQLSWDETTGIASVQLLVAGKNLYSRYKTVLSGTGKSLWLSSNDETGGPITITSVTGVDGNQSFTVDMDQTDTDYPAGAQGVLLTLVGPSGLNTANVVGFEAGSLLLPTSA